MQDKPRYSRVSDILDLAIFMSSKIQGVTLNEISARYNVSRRTAERMRDSLTCIFPQVDEIETDDAQKHTGQHRVFEAERRGRGHAGRIAIAQLPARSEPAHGLHRHRGAAHPLRLPLLPALLRARPDHRLREGVTSFDSLAGFTG